ncbi:glycerophosphodiester phosphodiesterase family protein [Streptomyces sp. NPDC047022]|uniref:glycerophosphodiester phosphodiesterase n=1 Tax=Streptomyces sp. NPDC047022 TaxID=3155737 RepID=UPI0033D4296D
MQVRVAATTTTALFGLGVAILPTPHAGAAGGDGPVVVAHRGACGYAPENTLASIDRAAAMGATWVENDVQRTRDGQLVVIHDATLDRTTDVKRLYPNRAPWRVKDFTAREIARLDAGSWFGQRFAGVRVPTLRQYMERVSHNHQSLVLEIKNPELYPGIERQTLGLLGSQGWLDPGRLRDRLVVQSFSADSVRKVHALRPAIRTAYLGTPKVTELKAYARFADQINSEYTKLSPPYVSAVHALKGPHSQRVKVFAWTVNRADEARRLAGFGVDGIITNVPDVVRRATTAS